MDSGNSNQELRHASYQRRLPELLSTVASKQKLTTSMRLFGSLTTFLIGCVITIFKASFEQILQREHAVGEKGFTVCLQKLAFEN